MPSLSSVRLGVMDEYMACQRCAIRADWGDAPSKNQAVKRGYIERSDHHTEADCIRRLAQEISALRTELLG